MYFGLAMLVIVVVVLSLSAIHGAFRFRELTKNVRTRARELPLIAELNRSIADLRVTFSLYYRPADFWSAQIKPLANREWAISAFVDRMRLVRIALENYSDQLLSNPIDDPRIADVTAEMETVQDVRRRLDHIEQMIHQMDLVFEQRAGYVRLEEELEQLQPMVDQLPGFLKLRMDAFAEQVRGEYYSWIVISLFFLGGAILLLAWLVYVFRRAIFKPLEALIGGSRRVASGDYQYRIDTRCEGELADLALAFNDMTSNFYEIKTDLDEQVRLRTKEIVRKEQLASVGFLAAGVAHEINNPLAAIAWSAESLETRLHEILSNAVSSPSPDGASDKSIEEMKLYLQRIQSEAFRCKNITAGLLDFSRLGDTRKSRQPLRELLVGVAEMVAPLPRYRDREVRLECPREVFAEVNPQEFKQIVLNLLTNALDSVDSGGTVLLQLTENRGRARFAVSDNGCGMTDEVQQHLFEPFFTRRRDGQGTGLGLSITYRIIEEHRGTIRAHSEGAGRGSRFEVTLPLSQTNYETLQRNAA